ncbi:MAG: SGNH/GDSL hydrolase family protein [Pararhodobacter sp.]
MSSSTLTGHPAARVVLAPLLLVQALGVRRRALILPEPEGPRAGVAGAGPVLRLLIAGDSSAAGVGVSHQDQALSGQLVRALAPHFTVHWALHATTGHTTAQTLERLRSLPEARFDVAVTALGVNDITRLRTVARFRAEQAALTHLLADRFGVRGHWRSGLPPMHRFPLLPRPLRDVLGAQARAFDRVLAEGRAPGRHHLPFDEARLDPSMMAEDGFHPGAAIYAAWAQDLAAQIRAARR